MQKNLLSFKVGLANGIILRGVSTSMKTSVTHKTAVVVVVTIPIICGAVGGILSATHTLEKKANQQY